MTDWLDTLRQVEALEDLDLDPRLVASMERAWAEREHRPVHFYSPTFKRCQTAELGGAPASLWPAVSITGSACRLQCDHCRARVLEPMLAAPTPAALWRLVDSLIHAGAAGMLLTGGSNLANKVEYDPYYETLRRIRDTFPDFGIAAHTGLVNASDARALEQCGLDVAMLDVIGAQDTISQVYHLRRRVEHFEAALEALAATSLRVVPHIVIGLHYGRLLGEWNALDMIARQRPDALVLVVVSPIYASPRRPFATPSPHRVAGVFLSARERFSDIPLLLGCMRPPGMMRMQLDCYALLAGLDGIAHPTDGVVELALRLGREVRVGSSCCSMLAAECRGVGADGLAAIDLAAFLATATADGVGFARPHIGGIPVLDGSGGPRG